jgi:hypothetical protein
MASPVVTNSSTDLDTKTLLVAETAASITGGLTPASDSVQVGWVLRKQRVLTNAEVKALPTTPITVVAAAGAGKLLIPFFGLWSADTLAGAYTNIAATASFSIKYADTTLCSTFIVNAAGITGGATDNVTQLLGNTRLTRMPLQQYFDVDTAGNWGLIAARTTTAAGGINSALQVKFDNAAAGALTGGNNANTLTVTLYYVVVPV